LEDTLLHPNNRYSRATEQNSLIAFRNGREDSGFLERCGRSVVVEPIFLVVSLGALVETVVRVVLTIVTVIASCFISTRSEEGEATNSAGRVLLRTTGESFCGLITSTGWIAKNIFAKKLHYTNDLGIAGNFLGRPLEMLGDALVCTGLDEVIRHMTCGVFDE
jgi:hypothetical protein